MWGLIREVYSARLHVEDPIESGSGALREGGGRWERADGWGPVVRERRERGPTVSGGIKDGKDGALGWGIGPRLLGRLCALANGPGPRPRGKEGARPSGQNRERERFSFLLFLYTF